MDGHFAILIIFSCFNLVITAPCTVSTTAGQQDTKLTNDTSPYPGDSNSTILLASPIYTVPCCGVVHKWEGMVEGLHNSLGVQVWRPVTGQVNMYMLLGENGFHSSSTGTSHEKHRITKTSHQIHVTSGDVIGFAHDGTATLRYSECDLTAAAAGGTLCSQDVYYSDFVIPNEPGSIHEFNTLQSSYLGSTNVRAYAIAAHIRAKSPVTCENKTKIIPDTLEAGDHVTRVDVEFMDLHHVDSIFSIEDITPPLPVTLDTRTGDIAVSGTLTPASPFTKYDVTVRVTDVCTSTYTCIISIRVNNVAKPIVFMSLPANVVIDSSLRGSQELQKFSISRQRNKDDVTCFIRSSSPETTEFEIRNLSKTEYSVTLKDGADIDAYKSRDTIVLLISCDNSGGHHNQSTLTLILDSEKDSGTVDSFWIVGSILGAILLTAAAVIFFACLVKTGKIKVWPDGAGERSRRVSHTGKSSDVLPSPIIVGPVANSNGYGCHGNKQFLDKPPTYQIWEPNSANKTPPPARSPRNSIGQTRFWEFQSSKTPRTFLTTTYEGYQNNTGNDVRNHSVSPSEIFIASKKPWKP